MSKQTINIGSVSNDGTGDPLRTAFDKVNDNFTECYAAISAAGGTDSFVINPADNATDGSVATCFIAGGGAGAPNLIGSTGKPLGADHTPTGWADDSGYVTGDADVASISGGYDHVCNQIAGTICGGGHNFIKANSGGHSIIGGGSYHVIAGSRSGIFSGRRNVIDSTASYCFIGGGDDNELLNDADYSSIVGGTAQEVKSDYAAIVGGNGNTIGSSADYSAIVGGNGNSVADSRSYCFIGTGNANAISGGTYSAVPVGIGNAVSGSHSVCFGNGNTVATSNSLTFGTDAVSRANGITFGATQLVEDGDAQSYTAWTGKIRTTTTGFNSITSDMTLPAGKVCSGTMRVTVHAMRDGSADANNDASYLTAAWQAEVTWLWDGANGYFATASTTAGPSASPTINLTAIRDDITVAGTPRLAVDGGLLRVQVNGKSATIINWVVRFDGVMTLVS